MLRLPPPVLFIVPLPRTKITPRKSGPEGAISKSPSTIRRPAPPSTLQLPLTTMNSGAPIAPAGPSNELSILPFFWARASAWAKNARALFAVSRNQGGATASGPIGAGSPVVTKFRMLYFGSDIVVGFVEYAACATATSWLLTAKAGLVAASPEASTPEYVFEALTPVMKFIDVV